MKTRMFVAASSLILAVSVHAQTRTITNQLVVHLSFDNTMNDDSGRGNNAAYVSTNGLIVQPSSPTYVPGKLGQGFQFNTYPDGSLIEYATLGYPADVKFGTSTDFSIAFWIKTYSTNIVGGGDPAYIANRNWNSSSSLGWGVFLQGGLTTVRVHYTVTSPSVTKLSVRPPTPASENLYDGAWHHLAVTCQRGGNTKTYVDGVLEDTSLFAASTATLDTDALSDNGIPETVNIGQDGTGTYTQGSGGNPPATTDGTAGVTNAAIDDVGIWRRVLTDVEVANIYNFAQKGTNLYNVPDVHTPLLLSFTPNNGAAGILPNVPITAKIQDQDSQLDPSSVQLFIDGVQVTPTITKVAATNTITYTSTFLFAPLSAHTNKLIFADNGTPATHSTNINSYTVALWSNIYLPAPLYLETFDEVAPSVDPPAGYPTDIAGNTPAGWVVTNCSYQGGFWDIHDPTSDNYANFAIVPVGIITTNFNYDGRINNVLSPLVVNGALVTSPLGSNMIAFAASDQRSAGPQYDVMFTSDYNLTGQSNIWVGFNNMWSPERGEFGSLEYSTNHGSSWLPVVYYLNNDSTAVVYTNGVFDPVATITNTVWPTPRLQPDNCSADPSVLTYSKFLGVDSSWWASLGPYIILGQRGDHVTYHRVEKYRLPWADGQANVRFRFAFSGRDMWDWGFDNFGIYSIPPGAMPQITSSYNSGGNIIINWNGTGANAVSGLQRTTTLNPPNWVNISGTIGLSTYSEAISGNAAYYRVVRY